MLAMLHTTIADVSGWKVAITPQEAEHRLLYGIAAATADVGLGSVIY